MYTEPVIKSLSGRAYIEYYFNGERQREYNGKRLSLTIFPNKAKNQPDKVRLLNKLRFELRKALDKGWNPLTVNRAPDKKKALNLESAIKDVLHAKLADNYSRTYKRDLQDIAGKLLAF
jgi:DNA mismatch repair ATPase MutL